MDEIEQIEEVPKEKKMSFKNKMMLLAIFSILLGFVIKTEAAKRVTVGFEDYKVLSSDKLYDINGLQKNIELQAIAQEEQAREAENRALEAAQGATGTDKTTCDVEAGEVCN